MAVDEKCERYRMVLLGEEGVGKSALLVRFLCRRFLGEYDPDIEDVYAKKVNIDGQTIVLEVLDTSVKGLGTSRRHEYMKTADAVILVYSTVQLESFRAIMKYKGMAELYTSNRSVPFGLVGTKKDLSHLRQVSWEEGERLAVTFGWTFHECSSSNDDNIEGIFNSLVRRLRFKNKMNPKRSKKSNMCAKLTNDKEHNTKKSLLSRLTAQFARTNVFGDHKNKGHKSTIDTGRQRGQTVIGGISSPRFIKERRRSYSMTSVV